MIKMLSVMVVAGLLNASAALGSNRIVFVDAQEVFKQFYKTKLAQDQIQQQQDDVKVEMDEMQAEVSDMKEIIEGLRKDARDRTLSEEVRASKREELEEKLVLLQKKEKGIIDFETLRNEQINRQKQRMTTKLFDEIQESITLYAREKGYDAVIDRSAVNLSRKETVLYVNTRADITGEIISVINKGSEAFLDNESINIDFEGYRR
jgi:outer membrane protein